MSVKSDIVKFWIRMEKKMVEKKLQEKKEGEKKLQEKKEEEKNRDTVATVTWRFINLVLHVINLLVLVGVLLCYLLMCDDVYTGREENIST